MPTYEFEIGALCIIITSYVKTNLIHVCVCVCVCINVNMYTRQLIFLRKSDCLGCAVLLCFVVCLT